MPVQSHASNPNRSAPTLAIGQMPLDSLHGILLFRSNYKGYRFKLLKGSDTSDELGGKKSFLVEGRMQLGFAFVAYPFAHGASGAKTFQISNAGSVFEKDLGEKTLELVAKHEAFNPDPRWKVHEDDMALLFEPPENDFQRFTKSNAGKTVMSIAENIDLGLWPDEGFFMKYRRSAGMVYWPDGNTWYGFSDLPGPSPRNKLPVESLTVAGVAIVAAIAIPNLLRSRMAANETAAAAGCKAYAEAQEIYHRTDYDKDGVLEYAQSIGGDNSLLETKAGLKDIMMVDPAFAAAEGNPNQAIPKAGYCFKVLKMQGEKAPGGKRSYIVGGNMTLAYALMAYPAVYDNTGRNTFLISSSGTLWQRDLGPTTHATVSEMTEFNPDSDEGWVPAE